MCVKNLVNLVTVDTPMLEWTVTNHPLIVFEVLFHKVILVLIFDFKIYV